MLHLTYASLIDTPSSCSKEVAEEKNPYHILTERHLQVMWLEQKYFTSLKTSKGELIEVLSPGIWNSESGPDFLKAHIKIGNQEWRGDIEIHLSQEGWYHHKHHINSHYNAVILHVCYWKPIKERQTVTAAGRNLTSTYLQPSLTITEARIVKLIDLDLYPYKHFVGSGNCSKTLFSHLSKSKISDLFRSAAVWRLKEKWEGLQAKIENPENYLIGGIATVLGYKHNAEAFLAVFNYLKLEKIEDEQLILSQALKVTHFFNEYFQKKWADSAYYQQLLKILNNSNSPLSSSFFLKLDKIRPANHPVRRLAALAKILSDPSIAEIHSKLIVLWHSHWEECHQQNWKKLKEFFLHLIPSYSDDYWQYHYTFEKTPQPKQIALIGDDIKQKILINVFLPILYANIEHRGTHLEKMAFTHFYSSIPTSKTQKSSYLNYRFFGNKGKETAFSSADFQQGAYQIHRDFCIHFEASCQGCPFVERYKKAWT